MGFIDKLYGAIRLSDDDDYYDDEYDEEEEEIVKPRRRSFSKNDDDDDDNIRPMSRSKVTPMPRSRKSALAPGMEVCVIKPTSVEDSRAVVDTLLENRTVVINLEGITVEAAQRIMDYTSGANAALDGNLQKISRNIFIVTPRSVDISGDFQDLLTGSIDMYDNRK